MFLSNQEELLYKLLLQDQSVNMKKLQSKTVFDKQTVTKLCDSLVSKGLLKIQKGMFLAIEPNQVLTSLKDEKQKAMEALSSFEAEIKKFEFLTSKSQHAPQVKFYSGQESMTKVYEQALKSKLWRGLVNYDTVLQEFEEYGHIIAQNLQSHKTDAREIVVDNEAGRLYKESYEKGVLNIRLLEVEKKFESDTVILDDRFFLISFAEHEMLVIEVTSPALVNSQLIMFNALWDSLQ